jgi:hypothetical protein
LQRDAACPAQKNLLASPENNSYHGCNRFSFLRQAMDSKTGARHMPLVDLNASEWLAIITHLKQWLCNLLRAGKHIA